MVATWQPGPFIVHELYHHNSQPNSEQLRKMVPKGKTSPIPLDSLVAPFHQFLRLSPITSRWLLSHRLIGDRAPARTSRAIRAATGSKKCMRLMRSLMKNQLPLRLWEQSSYSADAGNKECQKTSFTTGTNQSQLQSYQRNMAPCIHREEWTSATRG